MKTLRHVMLGSGLCSLLLAIMLPTGAVAGQQSTAEAAVAEARNKIDAGDKADGGCGSPGAIDMASEAPVLADPAHDTDGRADLAGSPKESL